MPTETGFPAGAACQDVCKVERNPTQPSINVTRPSQIVNGDRAQEASEIFRTRFVGWIRDAGGDRRASGGSRTRNPRITNAVLCQLKLRWLGCPFSRPGNESSTPYTDVVVALVAGPVRLLVKDRRVYWNLPCQFNPELDRVPVSSSDRSARFCQKAMGRNQVPRGGWSS